jgi:hypothetical protein
MSDHQTANDEKVFKAPYLLQTEDLSNDDVDMIFRKPNSFLKTTKPVLNSMI